MIVNKYNIGYYRWLCDMVCYKKGTGYDSLLNKLHDTPFTYLKTNTILSRDSCREDDGLDLRKDYINDNKTNIEYIEGECSVLEMLIALSRRIDDLCIDALDDSNIDRWFWRLISNLHLDIYDDNNYNEEKVDKILDTFMRRKYDRHGVGSLFPIPKYEGDMRKNDISMQMHHYLNKHNYHL